MKKILVLFVITLVFLCGCSNDDNKDEVKLEVEKINTDEIL